MVSTRTRIGSCTPGPASSRVASTPSMTGIRMSMSTTSGRSRRAASTAGPSVRRLAHHPKVGLSLQDHAKAGAQQRLVVDDEQVDAHVPEPEVGMRATTA